MTGLQVDTCWPKHSQTWNIVYVQIDCVKRSIANKPFKNTNAKMEKQMQN